MKFVVGIGNPSKEYEKTRHNIGFQILDTWVSEMTPPSYWKGDNSVKSVLADFGGGCLAAKPLTFVNNTGDAVLSIVSKYNLNSRDLFFVCDDVNLEFGKLRLRASGSAGGHHGLESVIKALGSEDFPRLRVGVKNENMPQDLTGFVLEPFLANEKKELGKILVNAASVCESWMFEGFEAAMNRLSRLQSIRGEKE